MYYFLPCAPPRGKLRVWRTTHSAIIRRERFAVTLARRDALNALFSAWKERYSTAQLVHRVRQFACASIFLPPGLFLYTFKANRLRDSYIAYNARVVLQKWRQTRKVCTAQTFVFMLFISEFILHSRGGLLVLEERSP